MNGQTVSCGSGQPNRIMEPTPEGRSLVILRKMLGALEGQEQRLVSMETKVAFVEQQLVHEVYITQRQAMELKRSVAQRVRKLCKDDADYRNRSKKLFSALWRSVQKEFEVPGYRELPRTKIMVALTFIETWEPLSLEEGRLSA